MNDNLKIDELIRSKRRTISLEIDSKAQLIIRAPFRTPINEIHRLIISKEKWIITKKKQAHEKLKKYVKKRFIEGDAFLYLGTQYNLILTNDTGYILSFDKHNFILHEKYLHIAKQIFTQWYKRVAAQKIYERAMIHAQIMGVRFNKLSISNASKRWGSCSYQKNISFSWRLIMAPVEVMDYVIVHELAHLTELNHSKKFWKIVEHVMPDYAKHRQWLKDNEQMLEF